MSLEKSSISVVNQKQNGEAKKLADAGNYAAHGAGNFVGNRAQAEKVIAIQRRGQDAQANNRRCMFPAEASRYSRFETHNENPPENSAR
jgi:hypothetical protein